MNRNFARSFGDGFYEGALACILELQRADGAIPWFDGGVVDPWNHTEAAMGLATMGELAAARRAHTFLADTQQTDGSWWGEYGTLVPIEDGKYASGTTPKRIRDTNFCAYPATGLWHYYLITGDLAHLADTFPMIERAINWVLEWQSEHGEIRWSADDSVSPENDSLFTGSCSIYKSLESAIRCAHALRRNPARWVAARNALGVAIRDKPERFDRTWGSKAEYAMDWYYPVHSGALDGEAARARIRERYDEFVIAEVGCRCVSAVPWVTIAESSELAVALARIGLGSKAHEIFTWQHRWRNATGAYWMGHQYAEGKPWPAECPAWTAGAIILAADALGGLTPASRLFLDCLPEGTSAA
jgi:hypothetical protein